MTDQDLDASVASEETERAASGGFDFSQAQVQKTIDEGDGAWMHICHPTTGEYLYADDERKLPCRVKVLSNASMQFARATHNLDQKLIKNADKMTPDEAKENIQRRAAAAIVAFDNVMFEGRELDGSNRADRLLWVRLAPNFVTQVQDFSKEADHFFD